MTVIRRSEPISREYVERLLEGAAPERLEDMKVLWTEYDPQFFVAEDHSGIKMATLGNRVTFDNKTLAIYWLLSFAGWRTIECYSPAVLAATSGSSLIARRNPFHCLMGRLIRVSSPPGTTLATALQSDSGLSAVENRLNEYV